MSKLNRSTDRGMSVPEVVHASGQVSRGLLAARTGLRLSATTGLAVAIGCGRVGISGISRTRKLHAIYPGARFRPVSWPW